VVQLTPFHLETWRFMGGRLAKWLVQWTQDQVVWFKPSQSQSCDNVHVGLFALSRTDSENSKPCIP